MGDVSGKGVGAALHMARLMSDFRYVSRTHHDPATLLSKVNNILFERARRGMFTTVVYAVLDMKKRTLKVANAGHHSILLLNKRKKIVECGQASGAPLGIIPKVTYKHEEIKLSRGDTILIYTDGAIEPKNKNNVPFGMQRVRDLLIKSG
ncbi:MAG: serine/threonine-protein phosphatase, partial [bacterium]|nr:serine/threonine-protein phosphatase [bacterium]